MRKVIGIGETVLDIIFRDEKPISALPGGSTFNAIISLGRSGVKASMISETGNDRIGQNIIKFMESNGIDASYVNVYPESKSPLSLAFLNDHNDADYIFYKDHPHDRIDYVYPEVNADDIVLFGSFFALNPVIRPQVYAFLDYARQRGAILYYDVNFRASHKNEVMKVTPNLLDNLEMADIVRGSSEDFEILFRQHDADTVYRSQIAFYTKKFIYTRSADPVEVRGDSGFSKQYPVLPTETVSTEIDVIISVPATISMQVSSTDSSRMALPASILTKGLPNRNGTLLYRQLLISRQSVVGIFTIMCRWNMAKRCGKVCRIMVCDARNN